MPMAAEADGLLVAVVLNGCYTQYNGRRPFIQIERVRH
jgi:hypothetical protein